MKINKAVRQHAAAQGIAGEEAIIR